MWNDTDILTLHLLDRHMSQTVDEVSSGKSENSTTPPQSKFPITDSVFLMLSLFVFLKVAFLPFPIMVN